MRIALLLASLLVLTGCASSEPAAQTPVQTTEQAEASAGADEETQELSDETAEEEPEEQDSDNAGEQPQQEESAAPEPEQSGTDEERDSAADEQADQDSIEEESELEEPVEESQEPEPAPTAEPTQTPEETVSGYTLAQVSERNSAAECWVVIDGGVYDLTQWIRSHPGGSGAILNLCGKDGSASFTSQHGGQARPSSTLDGYYLAPLVG